MKRKKTKKALSGSVLALVLCFVMLIGTTFAWFTSSDSTAVNTIQAGTLKVGLEMASEYDADGNVTKWVDATGETLDFNWAEPNQEGKEILWEPGAEFTLPAVHIKNNGTLALKYQVVVTAVNGDTKLAEVLDVTFKDGDKTQSCGTLASLLSSDSGIVATDRPLGVGGTTNDLVISMKMQEGAGNAYQGLSISGVAITVMATQDTVEYDSNSNQYDAGAQYAEIIITTADELVALATAVNGGDSYAGKTVCLAADIDLKDVEWTPIGNDQNKPFSGTFDGAGHTIKNLSGSNGLFGWITDGMVENLNIADANIENTSSDANKATGILANRIRRGGVIENVTVSGSVSSTCFYTGGVVGAITGNDQIMRIKNCTNNATVTTTDNYGHHAGGIAGYAQCDTTFDGCKNTGNVSEGAGYSAGGIVGFLGGCDHDTKAPTIQNCENTGAISCSKRAGGIVGGFGEGPGEKTDSLVAHINSCTNSGKLTGDVTSNYCAELVTYDGSSVEKLTLYIDGAVATFE